jgi:hypothetical protein
LIENGAWMINKSKRKTGGIKKSDKLAQAMHLTRTESNDT